MHQSSRQHYRKPLASRGLIYLLGTETEMTVRNISVTGLLAEIEISDQLKNIKNVFQAIQDSTIVDVFLEELRLAGEAEVVRVDMADARILIALEFKNITYDIDNLMYKRRAYRKGMAAPGKIEFAGKKYDFMTRNVSVEGLMIRIPEYVPVQDGEIVHFVFERLQLNGEIKVVWFAYDEDGGTLIGLQYIYMENAKIKGIPRFSH
ncbi:MAG: PilZ domain-containing protein [Gammaproteobacteria bacterium]